MTHFKRFSDRSSSDRLSLFEGPVACADHISFVQTACKVSLRAISMSVARPPKRKIDFPHAVVYLLHAIAGVPVSTLSLVCREWDRDLRDDHFRSTQRFRAPLMAWMRRGVAAAVVERVIEGAIFQHEARP